MLSPLKLSVKKEHRDSGFRISRKFIFSFIAMVFGIAVLPLIWKLGFAEKLAIVSVVSTQIFLLIITVAYVTGQAAIDIKATYGAAAPATPNWFQRPVFQQGPSHDGELKPSSSLIKSLEGIIPGVKL
jgi:hypothetical protein